jgi:hypothetical protein
MSERSDNAAPPEGPAVPTEAPAVPTGGPSVRSSDPPPAAGDGPRVGDKPARKRKSARKGEPSPIDQLDQPDEPKTRHPWGWIVLALLLLSLSIVIGVDLQHHGRYELVCSGQRVSLRRGRRLPQPFGYETLGGLFKPVPLLADMPCPGDQLLDGREAAESAFLAFSLQQVSQSLADPQSGQLKLIRTQLLRALQITQSEEHRSRREEAQTLLADLNYREARARLAGLETDLRTALVRLRETKRLAAERYPDIGPWITQLQRLLDSISPRPQRSDSSPARGTIPGPLPILPDTRPQSPSSAPARERAPGSPPASGTQTPGRGILM